MNNDHPLLGNHKPSAQWYTDEGIWRRIETVAGTSRNWIYDPCPADDKYDKYTVDGLAVDWAMRIEHSGFAKFIYLNPPTPAAPWALKALETVADHQDLTIIFAAFSEAVLWQVNSLMDYPICWVRNRINWIDGNRWKAVKGNKYDIGFDESTGKYLRPNPSYMKPSTSPRNYNAFVCISRSTPIRQRFVNEFKVYGDVRISQKLNTAKTITPEF